MPRPDFLLALSLSVLMLLSRWSKDGLLALAALAVLILFFTQEQRIAGASGLPLDDSWIHLHNTVGGADEMVVFETAWNRWSRSPVPCPKIRASGLE